MCGTQIKRKEAKVASSVIGELKLYRHKNKLRIYVVLSRRNM